MNLDLNFKAIYIAKDPIDFRCGVYTLAALVQDKLGQAPADQSLYIFTNRSKNRIKCVYYDGSGFWMFYKILSNGHFNWDVGEDEVVSLSQEQLNWLLDGLNINTGTAFKLHTPLYV